MLIAFCYGVDERASEARVATAVITAIKFGRMALACPREKVKDILY